MPRLATGEIVLVRHADVLAALGESRFHKPTLPAGPGPMRLLSRMFLLLDGMDHQRLRRSVAPLFVPSAVAARSEEIRSEADQLLDGNKSLDAAGGYADQLPLRLTGRWLGIESEHQSIVKRAGNALTRAADEPVPLGVRHSIRYAQAVLTRQVRPIASMRAVSELVSLARNRFELADEGKASDGAVFLTALNEARFRGDIDNDEAIATWMLLLVAGYETTANLISTTAYNLLDRPELLEAVRSDSTLIKAVIEETLRFDTPVPITARVATADVELPGGTVEKGETVIVAMIAANRDPEAFDDPNTFSIDRESSKHLGFAHGAHFCIGANLARAEASAGIQALIERSPVLEGEAKWSESFANRGISYLPVTFRS